MYILLIINQTKTQLYKIVLYNKPKKKAKAKINHMTPERNTLTVKGDTSFLANTIECIYKSVREPDFSFESDAMLIEMKPIIHSNHKYYDLQDDSVTKETLIKEYNKVDWENKHNVFQFNLIKDFKCLICNDTGINTHIERDEIGLRKEVDYPCQCQKEPKGSKTFDRILNYVENLKE